MNYIYLCSWSKAVGAWTSTIKCLMCHKWVRFRNSSQRDAPSPAGATASLILFSVLFGLISAGRQQAASIICAKEAVEAQTVGREGQERGLGRGQAAAGSQEAADGGETRRLSTAELGHGKRRQHRNLRPRGADPPLRTNQQKATVEEQSWLTSDIHRPQTNTHTHSDRQTRTHSRKQRMHRDQSLIAAQLMTGVSRGTENNADHHPAAMGRKWPWQMFNTIVIVIIIDIIIIIS